MKRIITSFNIFENMNSSIIDVTNKIDFDILQSLPDERELVSEGDIVISTYFDSGFNTYEFVVLNSGVDDDDPLMNLGNSDGHTYYDLYNAYHVVKKSTYEDSK